MSSLMLGGARALGVACLTLGALLVATSARAQANAPVFSKNFFVTGDFIVKGVGLKGTGVGGYAKANITIQPSDLPAGDAGQNAEPIAAFLYWATVVTRSDNAAGLKNAEFNGHKIEELTKILNPEGTSPCWSSGGGTGNSDGSKRMFLHRADVLPWIKRDSKTQRLVTPASYSVKLPDSGSNGNTVPLTLGATLLIIYRTPEAYSPLRSVVLYEGGFVLDNAHDRVDQILRGFYQTSSVNPSAKLSVIVGNGSSKFSERLLFNGQPLGGVNPFFGREGEAWDNPTFPVSDWIGSDKASATVSINHDGLSSFDCLSGGVFALSTTVQDTDGDGLLDKWEDGSFRNTKTPTLEDFPELQNADKNHKDLYVEINALVGANHTHLPSPFVLKLVGDAFKNAPPGQDVRVHFDSHSHFDLNGDDRLRIRRAPHGVNLLHPVGHSYYRMLRDKLRWTESL